MYECRCQWRGFELKENPEDNTMRCPSCGAVFEGMKIPIKNRYEPSSDNPCELCAWMDKVSQKEFPCSHCEENSGHVK